MSVDCYDENYLDFYDCHKCLGDLGEKWCNFKWRIYNLQLSPQEIVLSPVFSTRLLPRAHWCLEVKLLSPGDLKSIQLTLRRLEIEEKKVFIVDLIYIVHFDQETKRSEKMTLVYGDEKHLIHTCYYDTPFKRSKNEFIIIECKLRPNKFMTKNVRHGDLDETLPTDLRRILQSGELYDTVIEVGDQHLRAHCVILCARLQNFMKTVGFKPPSGNEKCVIKINDLPVSVVKEMLKYAYTGQAYLDLDTVSGHKDTIGAYSQDFLRTCRWEDNPFADTFFNYETDGVSWRIPSKFTMSEVARAGISLLRIYPSSVELSLQILEPEEKERGLTLLIKFCDRVMPKPVIVSFKYYLLNKISGETFDLGESEVLLQSDMTHAKVKLCSLLEVKTGRSVLCETEFVTLEIDFRFCYGSTKSSIKDLYEGQFDISKCSSCVLLSKDMEHLFRFVCFHDITVVSGGYNILAHEAVLIARWPDIEKYRMKEFKRIVVEGYDYDNLKKFVRRLYTGIETAWE